MEVLEFVRLGDVDPVYLDASYYVIPDGAVEKPYTLLFEVLRRSSSVSRGTEDFAAPLHDLRRQKRLGARKSHTHSQK